MLQVDWRRTPPIKASITVATIDTATATSNTAINDGSAIELSLTVGGATQTINVVNTSLEGTVAAINAADLGVRAELVNTGAASGNYQIQLVGESGAAKSFSMTSSDSSLNFSNLQTATDANLNVNGIDFTRSTNSINDIIGGVTLNLLGTTEGAATLGVNQNNQFAKANIVDFVASYNEVRTQMKELMSSEADGPLAGDSIIRSLERNLRNAMTSTSSTPGTNVRNLTDMGISINRYGVLELDGGVLDGRHAWAAGPVPRVRVVDPVHGVRVTRGRGRRASYLGGPLVRVSSGRGTTDERGGPEAVWCAEIAFQRHYEWRGPRIISTLWPVAAQALYR